MELMCLQQKVNSRSDEECHTEQLYTLLLQVYRSRESRKHRWSIYTSACKSLDVRSGSTAERPKATWDGKGIKSMSWSSQSKGKKMKSWLFSCVQESNCAQVDDMILFQGRPSFTSVTLLKSGTSCLNKMQKNLFMRLLLQGWTTVILYFQVALTKF